MESLRLLILEDSSDDALLIAREVARTWPGLETRRIETAAELRTALAEESWDAIVADYTLPALDALQALALVQEDGFDGPFVVVSGTVDEETTVAAMRAGAHDYVMKDSLRRLVPALARELEEARLRAESREAQRQLAEAESRFRALIENSIDVTTILGADGSIRYASPSIRGVLGFEAAELLGTSGFDLVHPDDVPVFAEIFRVAAGAPGATRTEQFRVRHRDGSWRLMEAVGLNLLADPAVRGMVVTTRDITSRHALEERLNQSERLEAVGQLAGGIAHDFNNVLLVIRGYSTVLRSSLTDPQQIADVDEIAKAADRATSLTRQLLAFGRRQVLQPRLLSVVGVVREIESLLRRAVPEDIELRLELPRAVPPVSADPAQIEQVLVNLVLNARDAIEGGGAVAIRAERAELGRVDSRISPPLLPGTYVALAVSDTGCGIDEEALPHIFEPFFTTKGRAGTGLGLSTVYGIVAQSGGGISVETGAGEGTTITVFLPAAAAAPEHEAVETDLSPGELERGSEVILLVEDEDPVRELVRRVLERAGYRVLAASRPSDALALLEDGEAVDLLLTDVVMPEMSGFELAARVEAERPAMQRLFISGYAHAAAQAAAALEEDAVLLQKPFAPDELARTVRSVLDGIRPETGVA